MTSIKSIRDVYTNIPKQQQPAPQVSTKNEELMRKTAEHLTKKPTVAPNIGGKQ